MIRPAALLSLLLLACGPGDTALGPLYRFVEPDLEARRSSLPPVSTLDDETRPTLVAHRMRTLLPATHTRVAKSGLVVMSPHLRGDLRGAKQLLVQPLVRRGKTWTPLSPSLVDVKLRRNGQEYVSVGFGMQAVGRRVEVSLKAMVVPERTEPVHETRPVEIPVGARLEFGTGRLVTGPKQSAVEFSLEVCEAESCERVFEHTLSERAPGGDGWHDHALPLEAYAGREVRFVFRTRHLDDDPRGFSFPVWSDPTVFAHGPVEGTNFILISLDTLRADHLPWHGYRRDTAPRLTRALVPDSTVFDDCVAPASTTGPSHMTLFTSLQPLVHGVRLSASSRQIPPRVRTLAQALRAGGLVTGAVTENGPLGVHKGFGRGFDSFRENKAPKIRKAFTGRVATTFAAGRAWLERQGDKRFFLFLHTYETHTPYSAPGFYDTVFADDPDLRRFERIPKGAKPIDYDREIRYADDEVAAFLSWARERGLLENTIVILTSDHGEAFLEHGYRYHGSTLFQEVLHVPLLVSGPGIVPGRVELPVGLIDLMPTVLELADLEPASEAHGRSLVPLLRGAAVDPEPWMSRAIYSEAWQDSAVTTVPVEVKQPTFSVRRGDRKVIRYRSNGGYRYSYFNLGTDPRERFELYPQRTEEVADLRRMLDQYEPISMELRAALQIEADDDAEADALDPEREEKLRALGYID
jgi:arylsulfatase A-like enzyme